MTIQYPDFAVVRTPLLPFKNINNINVESLKAITQTVAFQEAIFLASPSLYDTLMQWLKGELKDKKAIDKLENTLLKYILRASYRCTPFGLFAGVSVGSFSEKTNIKLPKDSAHICKTRIDMDYLCSLAYTLTCTPDVKEVLTYFPNNTIYGIGENLRYVEYNVNKRVRLHKVSNIDNSDYIQAVLEKSQNGAKLSALAEIIVKLDKEITLEEATEFISEMIDAQVLVSELEPHITGEDYLLRLITKLDAYTQTKEIAEKLQEINILLNNLNTNIETDKISSYKKIIAIIGTLSVDFEIGQLLQVDMLKPASFSLNATSIQKEVTETANFLYKIQNVQQIPSIKKFKELFLERYEDGQEIPLMELLDSEIGIGYPPKENANLDNSPLIQGIPFGFQQSDKFEITWNNWNQYVFKKYLEAINKGEKEVVLEEVKTKEIFGERKNNPLPSSMYAFFSVLANSAENVDNGDFKLAYKGISGPSAATLLGRFAYLDNDFSDKIIDTLKKEQEKQPEAIFAEIIHINQGRIGNISKRPVLRNYEIPILVQSGVNSENTILLSDLMVSVKYNKIILTSKKLKKEVLPRLSSAHNYSAKALPFYHFLCDLQFQGTTSHLGWSWSFPQNLEYEPRVVLGKTILSPQKWTLRGNTIKKDKNTSDKDALTNLKKICQEKNIPASVLLAEGDNDLPLNLENELHQKLLISHIETGKNIVLEENLFQEDNIFIENEEGKLTNEFVIPLEIPNEIVEVAINKSNKSEETSKINDEKNIERNFYIGSEWLYFKIYCGIKTADKILTETIRPLTDHLLEENIIDKWFFIRYNDEGGAHLRVRFHGKADFYKNVIQLFYEEMQSYITKKLVRNIQIDTYNRELSRYGWQNIIATENLFFYDSEAIVNILSLLDDETGDKLRWQIAMKGMDCMLNDFGLSMEKKRDLLDNLRKSFAQEFDLGSTFGKTSLGAKYRTVKLEIEQVMNLNEDSEIYPVMEHYEKRTNLWKNDIAKIIEKYDNTTFLSNLLGSYLHMFLNRFFRSKQRMNEAVMYDFLYQYYRSTLARESKKEKELINA